MANFSSKIRFYIFLFSLISCINQKNESTDAIEQNLSQNTSLHCKVGFHVIGENCVPDDNNIFNDVEIPTLQSPTNLSEFTTSANSMSVTFQWKSVPTHDGYLVRVKEDGARDFLFYNDSYNGNSLTLSVNTQHLEIKNYSMWVHAKGKDFTTKPEMKGYGDRSLVKFSIQGKDQVTCQGATQQTCTVDNGSGVQIRTCANGNWSNFGGCNVQTCKTSFHIDSNQCVADTTSSTIPIPSILFPNSNSTISSLNGASTIPIVFNWTSVSTNNGYLVRLKEDVAGAEFNFYSDTYQGTTLPVSLPSPTTGTKNYVFWIHAKGDNFKPNPMSGYGESRVLHFSIQSSSLPPSTSCIGMTQQSCTIENGVGNQSRTCTNGTWNSFGTCTVQSCLNGYHLENNKCLVDSPIVAGNYDLAIDYASVLRPVTYNASGMLASFMRVVDSNGNGILDGSDARYDADAITKDRLRALKPKHLRQTLNVLLKEKNYILNDLQSAVTWGLAGASGWRPVNACKDWWSAHESTLREGVQSLKNAGYTNVHFDVWNEPDIQEFYWDAPANCINNNSGSPGDFKACYEWKRAGCDLNFKTSMNSYFDLYQKTRSVIKSVDPNALITAPSASKFHPVYIKDFLARAIAANALPEIISWHELQNPFQWPYRNKGIEIKEHIAEIQAFLKGYGIHYGPERFEINEYIAMVADGNPSDVVAYLSELDSAGVKYASKACWLDSRKFNSCVTGTLNTYLTSNTRQPRGTYWAALAYAEQTGKIIRMSPEIPLPLEGIASYNSATSSSSILLGNVSWGAVTKTVFLNGLNSTNLVKDSKVRVIVERIPKTDDTESLSSPIELSNTLVNVTNGGAYIVLSNFGSLEARVIKVLRPQ